VTGVAILAVAVASTAFAQVTYRLFFLRGRRLVILAAALALFVVAQLGFFGALTQLEIGVVYMALGLTQVLVLILSGRVLGEDITRDHGFAVAAIVLGMALYAI
jgi:drug/metabolite transporter (DMT)-like permease